MYQLLLKKIRAQPMLFALVFATFVYLLWQMSLSGAIFVATTVEDSRRLSDLARWTVGVGAALLTIRIGYARQGRPFVVATLALILGYGATWLEDTIVNTLADRADGQARQDACAILVFNKALNMGHAQMTQLAPEISLSPIKLKAFSKVLGFAVWQNPALMRELWHTNEKIFAATHLPAIYTEVDKQYASYVNTYNAHAVAVQNAQQMLERINYAQFSHMLRQELANYSRCADAPCKEKLQTRINNYLSKNKIDIPIQLEDFCRMESGTTTYVMGRPMGTNAQRVCTASENELYVYAKNA